VGAQVRLLNLGLGGGFLSALSALLVRLNFLFVTIGVKIQTDFSRCPLGAAPYGSQGAGVDFPSARKWSFPLSIFQPCPPSAALRNLPPPQFHSDTFRRLAAAGPFPALASSSAGDDKASSLRLWLLSFDAFR